LVAGLRRLGVDSRLVDPQPDKNPVKFVGTEDRGALVANMGWAIEADILVNHSGYDNTPLEKSSHSVVHIAHGRPRSSFLSEVQGSTPIYSYWYSKSKDPRFAAIVTFWPQHKPYLEVMFPGKTVHYVPSSVDLEAWSPNGPSGYKFGGKKGEINLVLTDAFRDDIDPFVPLHAAALFARRVKGTRIHVYAYPKSKPKGWGALFRRLTEDGSMGELQGWVGGLANVYRAASVMLTPQEIDTRSVREAMACGCPVARLSNLDGWEEKILAGLKTPREAVRTEARFRFDPERSAVEFRKVLHSIWTLPPDVIPQST
jgi:glycosyltransferase involved in cell wall biosynthesis